MATDRHQAPSYPLRMPDELKARVQASAEQAGRSLHAELLFRIQNSFELASSENAELAAKMHQYELGSARAQIGILALLCAANGDLLRVLVDAVESQAGVPDELLVAARSQAEKARTVPDKLGYDPVKQMAELRRLAPLVGKQDDFRPPEAKS